MCVCCFKGFYAKEMTHFYLNRENPNSLIKKNNKLIQEVSLH